MRKAIYIGSFDPISGGHYDIISRSLQFCDQLIIAIGVNPNKITLFSEEERLSLINNIPSIKYELADRVSSMSFKGLAVEFAKKQGANIFVRGIRSVSDFEYEINLANVNKILAPEIETVFLPTSPELAVVSSSMVKEIAKYGGDISKFVMPHVASALQLKFKKCNFCGLADSLKLTEDKPQFTYCRSCGTKN